MVDVRRAVRRDDSMALAERLREVVFRRELAEAVAGVRRDEAERERVDATADDDVRDSGGERERAAAAETVRRGDEDRRRLERRTGSLIQ